MNWDEARPHQQQRPFPSGKASANWTSFDDTFHNSHGPFPEHSISRIWVIVYQEFNCHVILIQLLVTFFYKKSTFGQGSSKLVISRHAEHALSHFNGERLCGQRVTIELARGGLDWWIRYEGQPINRPDTIWSIVTLTLRYTLGSHIQNIN